MESASSGIDLPGSIFNIAADFFRIKKGLLLTYDKNSESFYPFASTGIDNTSLHRCILNRRFLEEENILLNGTSIHVDFSRDFLKNYLSRRLWDVINTVTIIILNHNDNIIAVLLIFNSDISGNENFFESASVFIRLFSDNFAVSRSKIVSNLDTDAFLPNVDNKTAASETASYFDDSRFKDEFPVKSRMLIIRYSPLLEQIIKDLKDTDIFMLERDIYRVLKSMLNGQGCVYRLTDKRIFMTFISGINNDPSVFGNQIITSLMSLFGKKNFIKQPSVRLKDAALEKDSIEQTVLDFLDSDS